jgi:hypothetical protein
MQIKLTKTAFWDIDINSMDEHEHAAFIIARVFQYGTIDDIKTVVKFFKPTDIKKAITETRGIMDDKALNLANLLAA